MNNEIRFELTEYYDLLNLHKALLEAKFHKDPDNKYVAGSPIIANICNTLIEKLANYDKSTKGFEGWTEWRNIEHQDFYRKRIIDNILNYGNWDELTYEEKFEMVKNNMSPFCGSNDEIDKIISTIDKKV